MLPLAALLLLELVSLQTIQVNQTDPCFLNFTAGFSMWDNCGMDEDYLEASLLGFEWVTGGWFSMILVSVLMGATYIKYHQAIYPMIVGLIFMPIAYYLFPNIFLTFAFIMTIALVGITVWWVYIRQTKEF